ncbi:hypothetical protein TrCOL_g12676 [Triparma columacea]|uniref:Uncharacterized protein n=1 Tax=Triparma columacea TaxID=722753 RepID=A0A9W7G5Q7_9STRA|nr:hypothetical protein TrCOL_g12676 [Triparma columacea]
MAGQRCDRITNPILAEETSYGLFDNLPLSLFTPLTNNKVNLYNKSKQSGFEVALLELTGYEILAAVLEPSMVGNSYTVVGGGAIIANFDLMDCKMVECTTSEALYLASTKALFVSPKTFTSPTPLLDEESSPLPLPPPHEITKSQYEAMTPTTKATYLLYDKDFNPRNIPRCRYVETKQGLDYVKSRLLPLLDSTVQKSLSTTKKTTESFISKKQFAADRRDEASRKGEPALARVWNEEFLFLRSLQYDPTSTEPDTLNDKDEWYAKNIRNSAPVSNIDELLKGTGLEKEGGS